jgi:hypothetical protein
MDLSFLLEHLFLPSILLAIGSYTNKRMDSIAESVDVDSFAPFTEIQALEIPQPVDAEGETRMVEKLEVDHPVSESVLVLQRAVQGFINDIGMLITLSLYDRILGSITNMFVVYIQRINERILSIALTEEQSFLALTDMMYVVHEVLPAAIVQMEAHFDRAVPELSSLLEETSATNEQRQFVFCETVAGKLLETSQIFAIDYAHMTGIADDAYPSVEVQRLIVGLHDFAQRIPEPLSKQILVSTTLECILEQILLNTNDNPHLAFSFGGVQQLILDVHFILRVCESIVTQSTSESSNAICERAMRAYFDGKQDDQGELKAGEWYDERVDVLVGEMGGLFKHFQ